MIIIDIIIRNHNKKGIIIMHHRHHHRVHNLLFRVVTIPQGALEQHLFLMGINMII